jgi:hypothetical protein
MSQVPDHQPPGLPLDPNLIYLPSEIAAYLRVSVRTLQSWRHRGGGPPFRKYGELVRYKGSAVLEWDASRSRRTTSDTPALRVVQRKDLYD